MERIFNIACILIAGAALGLVAMNAVSNPVEAKRRELDMARAEVTERQFDDGGGDYSWPFEEWRGIINARMKVWDGLTEPPKARAAPVAIQRAPEWSDLLQGVKALTRGLGDKVKIIYPGSDEAGDYVGVGGVISKGVKIKSIDRGSVTFEHHWGATDETRTHTIERTRL